MGGLFPCFEKKYLFRLPPHANRFSLRILNMNVWGMPFTAGSASLDVRVAALKTLMENNNYDIVLIQEAWLYGQYRTLASAFPYASSYGSLLFNMHGTIVLSR